eukprot:6174844-Pleurochrysis_carterae.AAC.2
MAVAVEMAVAVAVGRAHGEGRRDTATLVQTESATRGAVGQSPFWRLQPFRQLLRSDCSRPLSQPAYRVALFIFIPRPMPVHHSPSTALPLPTPPHSFTASAGRLRPAASHHRQRGASAARRPCTRARARPAGSKGRWV